MKQRIKSFVCNEDHEWHYYDGMFWTVTMFKGRNHLMACYVHDAKFFEGLPVIEDRGDGYLPNACDVEDADEHHLEFVNKTFGTNFIFTDRRSIVEG